MMRWSGLLLCIACQGTIGDASTHDPLDLPDDEPIGDIGDVRPDCDGVCIGETGLVRLTRAQYIAAIEAAFETTIELEIERLPADRSAGAFTSNAFSQLDERAIGRYVDAAEEVAPQLVEVLDVSCDPSDCGGAIVERYAPSLFRREVDAEEVQRYADLYTWSYPEDGADLATLLVIETLLQSPNFIYLPEPVADGAPGPLDGEAIAVRLASFLWGSVPDEALLEQARSGVLDTPDGIENVTRAMFDDARSDEGIARFHREWLGIQDVPTDASLATAMQSETEAFAIRILRDNPSLHALLTERNAPIDEVLAEHYGVARGEWVDVPGRAGILTHGSVMTAHGRENYSRAVHRGIFLLSEVLCRDIRPAPPSALDDIEPGDPEELTDRQQLAQITSGACQSCHSQINPAGFAFEHYDELGRFRTEDSRGRAVESHGTMVNAGDVSGEFVDGFDLMEQLAESTTVRQCVTRQWFRYALGRTESEGDATTLYDAYQAFESAEGNLQELIIAIVRSDAFRYRLAPGVE